MFLQGENEKLPRPAYEETIPCSCCWDGAQSPTSKFFFVDRILVSCCIADGHNDKSLYCVLMQLTSPDGTDIFVGGGL
jgi:hypothetical protein